MLAPLKLAKLIALRYRCYLTYFLKKKFVGLKKKLSSTAD